MAIGLLIAVALSGVTAQLSARQSAAPATKTTVLFDGKTLDKWRGYLRPDTVDTRWVIADGLLCAGRADGKDTHGARDIITKDTFGSFELTWEWRIAEGGNSGVKYFVLEDMDAAIGHEYQMIDDERHSDAKIGPQRQTAALYDVIPAANRPMRAAGQFNQSKIVVNGTNVEHWLNGTRVLQYQLESEALKAAIAKSKFKDIARFGTRQQAHILLQDHGDAVCFKNIMVRPL